MADLCPDQGADLKRHFPEEEEFFQHFDPTRQESLLQAINDLHNVLAEEDPPFDGIIGFSNGATLAASAITNTRLAKTAHPPLKLAAFICCGFMPPRSDLLRFHDPLLGDGVAIKIPTFHVVGAKDPLRTIGVELTQICDASLQQMYEHQGGHEIPRGQAVSAQLADGLRSTIVQALSMK